MTKLKKRPSTELNIKEEYKNNMGNILTIVKIDSLIRIRTEYKPQIRLLVGEDNELTRLVIEALILFYCWDKDFLEVGLDGLPKIEDLDTVDEIKARESLVEFIIKSMYDVDFFHPELRLLCKNVNSVSVVNVYQSIILLSLNVSNGVLH